MKINFKGIGQKLLHTIKSRKFIAITTTVMVTAGVVATAITAIKDTPKVNRIVDDAIKEKGEDLSFKEAAPLYLKGYWKTIAIALGTILLVSGKEIVNEKQYAALAATAALTADQLKSFKQTVSEVVDEKVMDQIVQEDSKKKMKAAEKYDIIKTNDGDQLFFDAWSGRFFYSDMEVVRRAVNNVNRKILDEGYASLNDFYWDIHLHDSDSGEKTGWCLAKDRAMDIRFDSILTDDGRACVTLNMVVDPHTDYDLFF